eukprot:gene16159-19231_t
MEDHNEFKDEKESYQNESDKDYFGVYALDSDDVLSGNSATQLIDGHEPEDFVMYEIGKFCELLLKGNPKLVEPLFSERLAYLSPLWRELYDVRHSFVSQMVIYHYISYSKTQLGDARRATDEKKGLKQQTAQRDTNGNEGLSNNHSPNKKLYHTVRLLHEVMRMLNGELPLVFLTGQHRDDILAIRRGQVDLDQVYTDIDALYATVQDKIDKLKSGDNPHSIPAVGDTETLNKWLVRVRRSTIQQASDCFSQQQLAFKPTSTSVETVTKQCMDLLTLNGVNDATLLFVGRSGSHLHGLANEKSSNDWIAVYATSTDTYVSLYPVLSRIDCLTKTADPTVGGNSRDTYVNGIQLFEVSYFLLLLCQGNHRAVELIYANQTPDDHYQCDAWRELDSWLNVKL